MAAIYGRRFNPRTTCAIERPSLPSEPHGAGRKAQLTTFRQLLEQRDRERLTLSGRSFTPQWANPHVNQRFFPSLMWTPGFGSRGAALVSELAAHTPSGLSTLNKDQIAERGARMARRDDREYREYLREEQRRQPGCPAREVVLDQRGQATSTAEDSPDSREPRTNTGMEASCAAMAKTTSARRERS